jgi:hypothetical protein
MKFSSIKRLCIVSLAMLPVLISCGVLLDDLAKIQGEWTLDRADFYVYSEALDSYRKYKSSSTLTKNEFFLSDNINETYTINFRDNAAGNFIIEYSVGTSTTSDYLIQSNRCIWSLNSFANSLTMTVSDISTDPGTNQWARAEGWTITNFWPLATLSDLELSVTSQDLGLDYIDITDDNDEPLQVTYMKGYFKR